MLSTKKSPVFGSSIEATCETWLKKNVSSEERILQLNQVAISQMKSLLTAKGVKFVEKL